MINSKILLMKQKNILPKCKRQLRKKSSSPVQLSQALASLLQAKLKQQLLEISIDENLETSQVAHLGNLEISQEVL